MQFMPVLSGWGLFKLTRRLKHKSPTDAMYFIAAFIFVNYGLFVSEQHKLFEVGYPAHPYILERRSEAINSICYYYPQILKNEIEFLHR